MGSKAEYIEKYSDFLLKIAELMDGGDWGMQIYLGDDWMETDHFDRKSGYYMVIKKTRIEPALNRNDFNRSCADIEVSYRVKLPEDYKMFGFWSIKASYFSAGAGEPFLQYFTLLAIRNKG